MKEFKTFINENLKKENFVPKIPKDIYYDKELSCKDTIDYTSEGIEGVDELFDGLDNSTFKIIYWDGNSRGYQDASDAIGELFPTGTYYSYIDNAEWSKDNEEDGILLRFVTRNKKHICVVDAGDNGYCYVCIEN
jgi:hypothetical protein